MLWWHRRWRPVATVGELDPGDLLAVTVEGTEIALGRDGERYFAVQRRCVHRGADLADGFIARGEVVCPLHGWRFSTATGHHAGVLEGCLATYPVRVVGDQIEVDPKPRKRKRR